MGVSPIAESFSTTIRTTALVKIPLRVMLRCLVVGSPHLPVLPLAFLFEETVDEKNEATMLTVTGRGVCSSILYVRTPLPQIPTELPIIRPPGAATGFSIEISKRR